MTQNSLELGSEIRVGVYHSHPGMIRPEHRMRIELPGSLEPAVSEHIGSSFREKLLQATVVNPTRVRVHLGSGGYSRLRVEANGILAANLRGRYCPGIGDLTPRALGRVQWARVESDTAGYYLEMELGEGREPRRLTRSSRLPEEVPMAETPAAQPSEPSWSGRTNDVLICLADNTEQFYTGLTLLQVARVMQILEGE